MAIINPWVEVWARPNASSQVRSVPFDWQPNKEYMIHIVDTDREDEIGNVFIKIPADMDIQPPSSTSVTDGFMSNGLDQITRATVASNGYKKFDFYRTKGNPYMLKIWERDLNPDPAVWNLHPDDNTHTFELWNTSQGRTLVLSDFAQDYEYLFVVKCDRSSTEKYYATVSFYNFASAYSFANKLHSRMVKYCGFQGWDEWFRLSGLSTTPRTEFKGPGGHKMYRIYRRPMVYNKNLGYYNTFTQKIKYSSPQGSKVNISRAKIPFDQEYIFVTDDTRGDDELCMQGQMYLDRTLIQYADNAGGSAGFATCSGRDNWAEIGGTVSSSFWWFRVNGGKALEIYHKESVQEYEEAEPDPDPPLPPPPDVEDETIPCEDRCLNVGDTYEATARVEVKFNDPSDWQLRNYSYTWSAPHPNLSLTGTEENGRVGLFTLRRSVAEVDSRAMLPYNISVTVEDNDYGTVGVSDSDDAVLTFEMPCVTLGNETGFSISDVDVDECSASDTDTTATFTITSDAAIEGSDVTVDWETQGATATEGTDYLANSGTVTFSEGETTKTVQVTVKCDDVQEDDETFKVVISNPSRGSITKAEGIGTILDATPSVTTVELASEGEQFTIYIFRDMSGSTSNASDVTTNGVTTSRDVAIQTILNDYAIDPANIIGGEFASVTMFTTYVAHVLANVPTNQTKVSILYITDATDGYSSTSTFYTYDSDPTDHPLEGDAVTTTISLTEVTAAEGDSWNDTIGAVPSHITDLKITVVRISGSSTWTSTNGVAAEEGYTNIINTAPAVVSEGSFESFEEYNTGASTTLNDRIESAALNTYIAYCSGDPSNTISVQAANEQSAKDKAKPILNCPDD